MTYVHESANLYGTACIGNDCSIGAFVEIGNNVNIGNNVKIGCGVFIPENVIVEDDVFIGPHVVFTNDKHAPSKGAWKSAPPTVVKTNASIGANSTILPNLVIGIGARVGAGSVVTRDVPDGMTVVGNPAKKL
jgi:acetyltransferase-like isoleucine patch superfamily enzyme